ncbi:phosphatidylinositol-3-phosphate-binding protein BEM1, partial [Ascoidea rubescens DSM 1968]
APKKVIQALYDYNPQGPGELKFSKDDFFYVISNENDKNWYEAFNPITNVKGKVPIKKTTAPTLYGTVLYNFKGEKEDELDVEEGEYLVLCAHHEFEWFIAKPIDRLGGPGLVPVSYIKIMNMVPGKESSPDVKQEILVNNLPTVQEWKILNAQYQASSIQLNQEIFEQQSYYQNQFGNQFQNPYSNQYPNNVYQNSAVSIERLYLMNDEYWYNIICKLSNNIVRSLWRCYKDFFNFQKLLLQAFPTEAGEFDTKNRSLPFIPGPVVFVSENLASQRLYVLEKYLNELIKLPDHISKSHLVLSLFEITQENDKEYTTEQFIQLYSSNSTSNRSSDSKKSISTSATSQNNDNENNPHNNNNNENDIIGSSVKQTKIKCYFEDDIFALLIPLNISFLDLKIKISKRVDYDVE